MEHISGCDLLPFTQTTLLNKNYFENSIYFNFKHKFKTNLDLNRIYDNYIIKNECFGFLFDPAQILDI